MDNTGVTTILLVALTILILLLLVASFKPKRPGQQDDTRRPREKQKTRLAFEEVDLANDIYNNVFNQENPLRIG